VQKCSDNNDTRTSIKCTVDEEIAEYWDSHILADYWDQTDDVDFEVRAPRRSDVQT
jgi:hypothetical protein